MRHETRSATRRLCILALSLTWPLLATAQQGPQLPVSVEASVIPATGDPLTIAALATQSTVVATVTNGVVVPNARCNRTATPDPGTPLVNPLHMEFADPFTAGKVCQVDLPTGLPNGVGYRGVGVAVSVDGLKSARVLGIPSFSLQPTGAPAALTGVVIRP